MKARHAMLAIVVAAFALTAIPASALEFHGYMRSGIGGDSQGGGQQCQALPGLGYKMRLGNECEMYGELEFDQSMYKDKNGVEFKYVGMMNFVTPEVADSETTTFGMRQSWVGVTLPQLDGATIWAGKRYYRRNDVHMLDFFYWDVSGFGAGIEDVNLGGFAKVAVAMMQSNVTDARTAWRPDVRIYGINTPVGQLEFGADLVIGSENKDALATGTNPLPGDKMDVAPWFTAQLNTPVLGGFNKLAVQYAMGAAAPMSQYPSLTNTDSSTQFRVVDQLAFQPSPKVSGFLVAVYEDMDKRYRGTDEDNIYNAHKALTIAARPAYHVNDYFKLQAEGGYQWLDPNQGGDSLSLYKITIAPTITPPPGPGGAYFTRPEIRLFATYTGWNDAAEANGMGRGTDKYYLTYGAQFETWF